jgi:hypothetical protein
MQPIILDKSRERNCFANTDEPDMLIVHCPRSVSVMPWDSPSAQFAEDYQRQGWRLVKEADAWHLITPQHPAMRQ